MGANAQRFGMGPPRRRLSRLFLCMAIVVGTLTCTASVAAGAEEPGLPSVGGGNPENLSIGIYWGLYEQSEAETPDKIGIVGAPMPLVMEVADNGEHRLFAFIQHRNPGGPYCAETPAELEDIAVDLTGAEGDPTIAGPEYSEPYVWTPTEPGEYTLCAYLDSAAGEHPVVSNFVQLVADPAPGRLSLAETPEVGDPEHVTVKAEGEAVVPSEVTASVQEQGLPCTLPDGKLAGRPLIELPGGANSGSGPGVVGPGPFVASYEFVAEKPGPYEVCAYLTPAPTEKMYSGRPYEVGSLNFSVQEAPVTRFAAQRTSKPEALPAPRLDWVKMSNRRFRVASGRAHASKDAPMGTIFRFGLSETATVRIEITRLTPGRRVCDSPRTPARIRSPGCDHAVAAGSIVRHLGAGGDAIPFDGFIGHRRLRSGSYRAIFTAHNGNGDSRSVTLQFNVAR